MASSAADFNSAGVYLVSEEYYFDETAAEIPDFARHLTLTARTMIENLPRIPLIKILTVLNHFAHHPERASPWLAIYQEHLTPDQRVRFAKTLREGTDDYRLTFCRQAILHTMSLVFTRDDQPVDFESEHDVLNLMFQATILCHVVASTMTLGLPDYKPTPGSSIDDIPEPLLMYFFQNSHFNSGRDPYIDVAVEHELWFKFGNLIPDGLLRHAPVEMATEAIGCPLEEFIALGFGLYAHASSRTFEEPFGLDRSFNSSLSSDNIDAFLGQAAWSDISEIGKYFRDRPHNVWDFLPMQYRPALLMGASVIALDEDYVLDLFRLGTFWRVHEHERLLGSESRKRWTRAYGAMVELMAKDILCSTAPLMREQPPLRAMYGESYFPDHYKGKRCDVLIDLGQTKVVAEIVSGRLTNKTRIEGDVKGLLDDVEKLVIKKARQLDESIKWLAQEQELSERHPDDSIPPLFIPIVVIGGDFLFGPLSSWFIEAQLRKESLLQQPWVSPLAIVELSELMLLDGIVSAELDPWDMVVEWKRSTEAEHAFSTFLRSLHPDTYHEASRSPRILASTNTVFQEIMSTLDLQS